MAFQSDSSPVSALQIAQAFPDLVTQTIGDAQISVVRADSPERAYKDSLIFLSRPDAFAAAMASDAPVVVLQASMLEKAQAERGSKTLLVVSDVDLAMALIISRFFMATPFQDSSWQTAIHPTAVVHPTATLGSETRVGPYAVISAGVQIGAKCFIGAHAVIEQSTVIGDETTIHPLVYIGHSTQIGKRCEVLPHSTIGKEGFGYGHDKMGGHHRIPHQGRVVLEDDVHIGSSVCIDRGTFRDSRIGAGTKIDNLVHLAHNSVVGRGCLLTAGLAMAGSSTLGNFVITGGKATVTGHVTVGDHVRLAGLAVVSKSVTEPGDYGGFPLVPLQDNIKMRAALVHLADMRKQVARLVKKVFPDDSEE